MARTLLAALVLLAAAVAGCGSDDCTNAQDHVNSCTPPSMSSSSSSGMMMAGSCSGFDLCRAQCLNAATCAEINGNAPSYTKCLTACEGK
jgi:hypothetical protein